MLPLIVSQTMASFLSVCSPFAYVSIFLKLLFQESRFLLIKIQTFYVKKNVENKPLIKSSRYFQKLGKKIQNIQNVLEF